MKPAEDLSLYEIEKLDLGEDFKLALARAMNGANVYIIGPAGSGKSALLRKLGLHLSRINREGIYVKLEWVKYGWGIKDYIKAYGEKNFEFIGAQAHPAARLVLLDDGELLWNFTSAYRNLIRDLRGRQIVAAFREIDVDMATILFGDGFFMYLNSKVAESTHLKAPLGLGFLGKTAEIVVI